MWRTSNIILELEVFLYAYFIGTIWIHVNRVIKNWLYSRLFYPYYVKPRAISNYLNLRFGHDEMDGRYGHSNF